jgi:hypothetical protein
MKPTPFLGWPGWAFLRFAWLLSTINALWFLLVYAGCEWITVHRSLRVPIHLPIEHSIPLVPAAVVAYVSIYALFVIGPFIVRERREFSALIASLAVSIAFGAIGFLLLPSTAAFPPPSDLGIWNGLFRWADRVNLDYNMVPSLHVALTVCCIAFFAKRAAPIGCWLLWVWAVAIALSTVLTHQHHVLDVATGWGAAVLAMRLTECRFSPGAIPLREQA